MEFPNLGQHCSESTCRQLDFLPMKCDACGKVFCVDHFTYLKHNCDSAYKKDVQVPVCPLCSSPVPVDRRGDPPDLAVSRHMDTVCTSLTGSSSSGPATGPRRCSARGCGVRQLLLLTCERCGRSHCVSHRHPSDHGCTTRERPRPSRSQTASSAAAAAQRRFQADISEDEALARAIQASLHSETGTEVDRSQGGGRTACLLA